MKTKTILASLAVSALALSQPAAAATRSYESLPESGVRTAASVERTGSAIAESEQAANSIWLIFAALGLTALLIALLTDGSDSPG